MTDKLAQRIVALGIGGRNGDDYILWPTSRLAQALLSAEQFVNDGRVVLALMEKCQIGGTWGKWNKGLWFAGADDIKLVNESLAVAICKACCQALEND